MVYSYVIGVLVLFTVGLWLAASKDTRTGWQILSVWLFMCLFLSLAMRALFFPDHHGGLPLVSGSLLDCSPISDTRAQVGVDFHHA